MSAASIRAGISELLAQAVSERAARRQAVDDAFGPAERSAASGRYNLWAGVVAALRRASQAAADPAMGPADDPAPGPG